MAVREQVYEELLNQFEDIGPKLTVDLLPKINALSIERMDLQLDDEEMRRLVAAALSLALTSGTDAFSDSIGALEGARAFFALGPAPTAQQRAEMRAKHGSAGMKPGSQAFRFAWARWQEQRAEHPKDRVDAPGEKSGRKQKSIYAAALADAIVQGLDQPSELRAEMQRLAGGPRWSRELRVLLDMSDAYVREVRLESDLYVERTIEPELAATLLDRSHSWPRRVVGEAGGGKTTLLWALHRRLATEPDSLPVLLGAAGLLEYLEHHPAQQFVELLAETRSADRTPVLLVDTVDLLLHNDSTRQPLLRLVEALHAAGIVAVYASRPQEAALLTHDQIRQTTLKPYDDDELDRAVTALVVRYCPDASPFANLERVRSAKARGLPVDDVCHSPLLLRMLFDLSSPAEPELEDVDVTRLFAAYWARRVVRDARTEAESGLRSESSADLSRVAGQVGIGLLASGSPELAASTLRDVTAKAGNLRDRIGQDIEVLVERGVLVAVDDRMGFFHQTMFEFATAKGLLAAVNPSLLTALAARTIDHGGDLFVGAVLEQVLILAGESPLLIGAAQDAITGLVATNNGPLQAIALVAWAHHPPLLDTASGALRRTADVALERAARLLPTIAGRQPGQTISQLLLLWHASTEPRVRAAVLASLTRLARLDRSAAEAVTDAVDYLDPLHAFGEEEAPEEVRAGLLELFRVISPLAPQLVRSMLVALLISSGQRASVELDYLAEQWPAIGDGDLLDEVIRAAAPEGPVNMAVAAKLGRVIAAEWIRSDQWHDLQQWQDALVEITTPQQREVGLREASRICAVGSYTVAVSDPPRTEAALKVMLDCDRPEVRDIIRGVVLREILTDESEARKQAAAIAGRLLATVGADAQKGRIDGRQQLILEVLEQSQLSQGLLARAMPGHLEWRDWTADTRLLRLAPSAADDGHASALRLVHDIKQSPNRLESTKLDALFSTVAAHLPSRDDVFDSMLLIALGAKRASDLSRLVTSVQRRGSQIEARAGILLDFARELISRPGESRAEGMSLLASLMAQADLRLDWTDLRGILESIPDPKLLTPLIQNLWQQTPNGNVDAQLNFLGQYVQITPDASRPVTRTLGTDTTIMVAAAATEAYIRILGTRALATVEAWPTVRALALWELEQDECHVVGTRFAIACDYLERLGVTHRREAARFLTEFLGRVGDADFYGFTRELWAPELVRAIKHATSDNSVIVIDQIAKTCVNNDEEIAEVIASTLAETNYADAREPLRMLGKSEISPQLRSFMLDLVRDHDRSFGTTAYPQILEQVAGQPPGR